tara:strand:- start:1677 stop:2315 length:639 start_codon:yes stop_codon:yes gene_type:complete
MASTKVYESLRHEINGFFTTKIESFIQTLCTKYDFLPPEDIINDWKEFNGKVVKPKSSNKTRTSIQDLKDKCRSYGLKVGGKKQDLIERIRAHEAGEIVSDSISIKELKTKLKEKGLKVGGSKQELLKRLSDSEGESDTEGPSDTKYSSMKVMALKLELKTRGLKTSGNKTELVKRLNENDEENKEEENETEDKKLSNDTISDSESDDCDSE